MTGRCVVPLALLATAAALAACGGGDHTGGGGAPAQTTATAPPGATEPGAPPRGVRLAKVGAFESPLYATAPPGDRDRLFVVEQGGAVRIVKDGAALAEPFLDLSGKVSSGGERGLLSIAFAPDYARSGRLYVDYTDRQGDSRVVEYRVSADPDRADPGSARQILFQAQPFANHNGGQLQFGPDGMLYIGFGDGGSAGDPQGNGQDRSTWLGKILRVDPRSSGGRPYTVPRDNPFVGEAGVRPEIWDYGLRNPWRFSFDSKTRDMWIGDVGQDEVEEIDWRPRGRTGGVNFGWKGFEGTRRFDEGTEAAGAVPPVFEYFHGDGDCSVTGGYAIRDPELPAALQGRYLYGDYCGAELRTLRLRDGRGTDDRRLGVPGLELLSSFGEDGRGRLYAVSSAGPVYRLAPQG